MNIFYDEILLEGRLLEGKIRQVDEIKITSGTLNNLEVIKNQHKR
jgi:hypothetical protein